VSYLCLFSLNWISVWSNEILWFLL
jgi:hypothetical protein